MSNVKPILIVRCPWLKDFNMAEVTSTIKKSVEAQAEGYIVLCFTKDDYKEFKFEVHGLTPETTAIDVEQLYKLLIEEDDEFYELLQASGVQ